jgi:NTP pyrophosphatase (non-canonical NTP hydrolase)
LDFYSRFHVSPRLPDAAEHFLEEVQEFVEAAAGQRDKSQMAEEAADVLVTLMGVSYAAGLTTDELAQGIFAVIAKNDAKTPRRFEAGRYGAGLLPEACSRVAAASPPRSRRAVPYLEFPDLSG